MRNRKSSVELLRLMCILFIISDHFTGQSGIATYDTAFHLCFYTIAICGSRIACAIFVIISAWYGVEQKFNFGRVMKIWLATLFYVVMITMLSKIVFHIPYDTRTILQAFLPISGGALWFVSYYMILMLISPLLNYVVNRIEEREYRILLLGSAIPVVLVQTVLNRIPNPLCNEMWGFIYIWFLTGYFKRFQPKWIMNKTLNFVIMFGGQATICFVRAYAQMRGLSTVLSYMETYRAMFWTLPPLMIAYCSFFFFYSIDIGTKKTINKWASATLGIYVIHQVPGFYPFLWNGIFKSAQYVGTRWQISYGVFVVFTVFLTLTIVDIIRQEIFKRTVERTRVYRWICDWGNQFYKNMESCISGE